jgi:large subunit ribosomal protein L21
MFAIISSKGVQYRVEEGKEYKIDILEEPSDKKLIFSDVLIVDTEKGTKVGAPFIEGATVEAEFIGDASTKKVKSTKFRPKKRYQRNLGHKQHFSLIKVLSIKA